MKNQIILLLLSIFILSNCSESIKLSRKGFSDIVPLGGNIHFTFNQDMVPESKINVWDTVQYIVFDPPLHGKFKWKSARELVFSPYHYLRPSMVYSAAVNSSLSGLNTDGSEPVEFHTPLLALENFNAYYAKEELKGDKTVIRYDFVFNYKIKPADLKEKLIINIEGKPVKFELLGHELSEKVSLIVDNFDVNIDRPATAIKIAKGLNIMNLSFSKDEIERNTSIVDPSDFKIEGLTADHDGFTGTINVVANQDVVAAEIRNFIEIIPKVEYTVQVEGRNIIIKSEKFDVAKTYEINIKAGLTGSLGGKLKYEYTDEISFGTLDPEIRITDNSGEYLSAHGFKNIEVRLVSVPEVLLVVKKVYKNNLNAYLGGRNYNTDYYYDQEDYGDEYYDDYYYYDYGPQDVGNLGDLVLEKTLKTSSLPASANGTRLLNLDFKDIIPEHKGIYVVELRSKEDYWVKARKIISISDIGLIAKSGKDNMFIFANSISTAKPLEKVKLEITGKNNQLLGTVETNKDGFAVFAFQEQVASGFIPAMVSASFGTDFNVLPFNRTKIGTSRFEVTGKNDNPVGFDVFIYGDRDIYRPGETAYASIILRDESWNIPGQIPLKVKVISPNGKTFKSFNKTINNHGAFETELIFPVSAPTGNYTIEVYTSTDVFLNSKTIKLEEFVPDKIKVNVSTNLTDLSLSDIYKLKIEALNLFGPPAANRNYEVQENIKRVNFYTKKFSNYHFGLTEASSNFESNLREGKTNTQGIANEDYTYPETFKDMGLLKADYFITVFDETGRPVNRYTSVDIYTQDKFFGLWLEDYYNKTNRTMKIPMVVVDKNGEALKNVQAQIKIIKHEYRTVLAKSGEYFRYKSEHEEVVLENKTVTISGDKFSYHFTPKTSGRYDVRISKPGTKTYVQQSFYAYGFGSTTNSSFQVNKEGHIDIEFDKKSYKIGDKAKVILNTPFSGKVLVTIERKNVIQHFFVETDKRAVSFDLDIKEEFVPNVFVSATLFKPHGESDIPLTVAHGYAPVMVENASNVIPVRISAVEKSPSKVKQTIKVKSQPNTPITLAVVDEGILQITGYKTPDPHGFFYRKRALAVNSYNIYPYLFPELKIKSGREGGGEGGDMEKRINPMTSKRFKLVSFWSGIKNTDANGDLEYEIEIPQFSGDLRIMAVAYKGKAFGSGFANMKVADPVVISAALPRFLSPKDTVEMNVSLSNTSASSSNCKLSLKAEGPVKFIGNTNQDIVLDANSEKQMYFKLAVDPALGEAKIKVVVDAQGKTYENETEISVRPASPLLKINGSGIIAAGTNAQIEMNMTKYLPKSIDNKLIVSNSPLVQFANNLDYLVQYPHGCVEQTVSSVFPQLYFADLAGFASKNAKLNADENIKNAIRKLQLMQLYNGAMSYWPGYGEESWWGSAFAAHFLIEAQKSGYEVDASMINKLMEYLKGKVKDKNTIVYWYNGNKNKKIAPKELAYSLYVMALNGDASNSTMNYYKSNLDLLSLDSKYLLAASYFISGDKNKYKQVLPAEFSGEESNPVFGGSFHSPVRDQALALNALLQVEPENQQIAIMAKQLSEKLKAQKYLNTQENVFALLALGKIAKKAAQSNITGSILVNNSKIADYDNKTLSFGYDKISTGPVAIQTKGKGNLYYFWEAEGISKDGSYVQEDKFLKVRRAFYDRFGKPITNNKFEQNDLVVIKLSIQGSYNTVIENVVITDILPAGFEIENPRITSVPGLEWITNRSQPVYMDIRDDRINFFVSVTDKIANYYYIVRAVTPGTFQMGPVGADAMYNAEYHSYHGAGVIRIFRK
jgi:alpha-2-macroglobulin